MHCDFSQSMSLTENRYWIDKMNWIELMTLN